MSTSSLRAVEPNESVLVFSFLTLAARMAESGEATQKALVDAQLTKYWLDWGRADDIGIVAQRVGDGLPLSCAWVRAFAREDPDCLGEGILVLACATIAEARGTGIGTRVLGALIEQCRSHANCNGISLSVRTDNPAVRLYERLGFRRVHEVTNRVGSRSLEMLLRFD
ncbi:MAG: GNAT family N-acetyltransferase [Polyangiaceae bacterium]